MPAPYGIALDVDGGKMYWTDGVMDKIFRANLDGSNVEDLVNTREIVNPPLEPGATAPASIALDVDGGKMYWTDWHTNKIQRADLNGSNAEDIITSGVNFSRGIALDLINRKIYYTDTSSDKIRRANMDGTQTEDTRQYQDPRRHHATGHRSGREPGIRCTGQTIKQIKSGVPTSTVRRSKSSPSPDWKIR